MTLIGNSPIGSSFTEALPDLSGRFRIIQMDRQKDVKIAELIMDRDSAAAEEMMVSHDMFDSVTAMDLIAVLSRA